MKALLCDLIKHAPAVIISHEAHSDWYRASRLAEEAATTKYLLQTLMWQYNSAVEPQASIYKRIRRLHDKAMARHRRRSVAEASQCIVRCG